VHGETEREQASKEHEASLFTDETTSFEPASHKRAGASRLGLFCLLEARDLGQPLAPGELRGDPGHATWDEVMFGAEDEASMGRKLGAGRMPGESIFRGGP
jgi:hypothetical protein